MTTATLIPFRPAEKRPQAVTVKRSRLNLAAMCEMHSELLHRRDKIVAEQGPDYLERVRTLNGGLDALRLEIAETPAADFGERYAKAMVAMAAIPAEAPMFMLARSALRDFVAAGSRSV